MKTIEDAVIELSGNFDNARVCNGKHFDILLNLGFSENEGKCIYQTVPDKTYAGKFVCTREEFESCAKRMGYINGYEWGVEYPTNGNRPDVGDVDFELFSEADNKWHSGVAQHWNFAAKTITKFRITDPRYKPMSKSEPEMSKECLNNFPFIGCLAEHISWGMPIKIKFLGKRLFVAEKTDASIGEDKEVCGFIRDLRPIRTHREKVIDAAAKEFHKNCMVDYSGQPFLDGLAALYNAGMLVLPQDSSDTED